MNIIKNITQLAFSGLTPIPTIHLEKNLIQIFKKIEELEREIISLKTKQPAKQTKQTSPQKPSKPQHTAYYRRVLGWTVRYYQRKKHTPTHAELETRVMRYKGVRRYSAELKEELIAEILKKFA